MASINKVILVGYLGRDPDVRSSTNGLTVANVSIATTFTWNEKSTGNRKEEIEWHKVIFYNRQAEVAGQYLKKGSQVYVEGRLRTRKYTGKDGIERYITEIIADNLQMLGSKADNQIQQQSSSNDWSNSSDHGFSSTSTPPRAIQQASANAYAQASGGTTRSPQQIPTPPIEDDIPF